MQFTPAGCATLAGRGGRVALGVGQGGPGVGAYLVGFDEHEVPVRLGVVRGPEVQAGRARGGEIDGTGQPFEADIGPTTVDVPGAGVRVERWRARADPVDRGGATELRELGRWQEARGRQER